MKDKETISCEEALRHVFDYIDHALAEDQQCEIDDHLLVCRSCYSRVEFERRLKSHLREVGEQSTPQTLQTRIRRMIKKF